MIMRNSKKMHKAIVLIVCLVVAIGLLSPPALAASNNNRFVAAAESDSEDVKIEPHNPYEHAKYSRVTQEYGPNTVYIQCEWEKQLPISWAPKQVCQFKEWPLIVMSRPDAYYNGKPMAAYFNYINMRNYPFGEQYEGFPYDFAEWNGVFTYEGINGTVEYGPTTNAPIGEGTYYVYSKVTIPSAKTLTSDGTFILGKQFTIEPSDYDIVFDANVPDNASTKDKLTGAMPKQHAPSRAVPVELAPNQFRLPGYRFDSWNTKPDGTGTKYANRAFVKEWQRPTTTLYAQWKPKTYTITYNPGDAGGDVHTETAVFDQPGKLKTLEELGWTYADHDILGWKDNNSGLFFANGGNYVNLCGPPDSYFGDPSDAEVTAQWVGNGNIIVAVTEDGIPQPNLNDAFSLKTGSGTVFTMTADYQDGQYVFDPSQAATHGGTPAALPPGDYDLCLNANDYPAATVPIHYSGEQAVSAVIDYYNVNLEADPAYKNVHRVEMVGKKPDKNGRYTALVLNGEKIKLKTTVNPGYHFDGYSAIGVTPSWEENNPMKAEQTIEVQGQADIMAHVEANAYTVHFNANTKAAVIGEMKKQDMVYSEPQNLFANEFVRSGYVFTGWNTKANGTGTAYKNKQSVKNLTTKNNGSTTLYAQWKKSPFKLALLTFDLAGGTLAGKTGSITVKHKAGEVIKMPKAPTRKGYTFLYWKGSKLYPGNKYVVKDNHTFTAVWKKKSNGGGTTKVNGALLAKMNAKGKTGLTIRWNKIKGAAGYDIFLAKCNHKDKKSLCKRVKNIKGNNKFTWTKSKLKKKCPYKAFVKAYVKENGKKKYVKTSPLIHAYTGNCTKKYTNAKSVKVNKTKVILKKGKTFKVKAKVKKIKKAKKLMHKGHAPKVRFMTSNRKIASVSASGKMKAKSKGSCIIYVYAHNGVSKQIKLTVK